MSELFRPEITGEVIEAYNDGFNHAIATHLGGVSADDIAAASDKEFIDIVNNSDRQPINPRLVAGESVGLPEDASTSEIFAELKKEYDDLMQLYVDNGVDGRTAIRNASNIIGHTEAYITGYSREIGRLTSKITLLNPELKAATRWHDKIWVPEEDMHDRLWSGWLLMGTDDEDMAVFSKDHARHMQVGIHVDTDDIIASLLYVTIQEGDTGPSYSNIAKLYGPKLRVIPLTVKKDEDRHTREYKGPSKLLTQVVPDLVVPELKHQFDIFDMPGREGINNFVRKTLYSGLAGILDPVIILENQRSLVNYLGVENAKISTDEAKRARDELIDPDGEYGEAKLESLKIAMREMREKEVAKALRRGKLLPAILGVTVIADPRTGELSFPYSDQSPQYKSDPELQEV